MMDTLTLWLGERLLIGSIQGAVVIALAWLACRFVPRIPAAAQSMLWWLVALKLVLTFAPVPALPVPLLPADFEQQTERALLQPVPQLSEPVAARSTVSVVVSLISSSLWAIVLLWFVILLAQAAQLVRAHRLLGGIVRRAVAPSEQEPHQEIADLAARLGLTGVPELRVSDEIDTPQVCGLRTPVVLMPTEAMSAFTADERRMTLCHELMHIRRRDLALGWVPACAERLFFFHPLARLAAREYVAAREAACDAAAVRALGVSATDYGRMLIRLGIGNAGPALAAGASPFSPSSLKRRLHMLELNGTPTLSRRWRWAIAVAAAAVIPMQLVARTPAPQETVVWRESPELVVFRSDSGKQIRFIPDDKVKVYTALAQEKKVVAEQVKKKVVADGLQKKFVAGEQLQKKIVVRELEKKLVAAGQERAVEEQKVDDLKGRAILMEKLAEARARAERAQVPTRAAEQARDAQKQFVLQRRLAEMLTKAEAQATTEQEKVEALRNRQALVEAYFNSLIRAKTAERPATESEQLRQMAERYRLLADEARRLADELERLRQSAPAK